MIEDTSPFDFANFMKVSSIVLSTALSAPGMRERATAMAPFLSRSVAPGCDNSILLRKASSHTRYLQEVITV